MYRKFPMVSNFLPLALRTLRWGAILAIILSPLLWAEASRAQDLPAKLGRVFQPEAGWSVSIADLDRKEILYEHRGNEPRLPASNMKLYVTATAFDLLGTRFRYRTPLLGRGGLDPSGTWKGDLLVRGSGDPTFSGRFEQDKKNVTGRLERWAHLLQSKGMRAVEGNLYGDDDIFDEDYWGQGWPDGSWCEWYTAPSGGLIFNDGCLDVGIRPARGVGQPPGLELIPDTKFVSIKNEAKTVGKNQQAAISFRRSFEANDLRLIGKIPAGSHGAQHCIALADPTGYFINVFKEVLEREGIPIRGEAIDADNRPDLPTRGWKVLALSESPTLAEICQVINTRSQNLFADSLLKTLGARKAGMGNWAGGQQVIRDWVASLGLDTENLHLQDGSGLSRLNRMTSHDTLGLLVKAREKPWFPEWKKTLAVSGGSEGSLRNRLKTQALKGRVHAKTGFINDVYALSGYFEAENGRNYGFSMIFNGKSHGGKHPHHRMEEALTLLARNPS